MRKELAGQILTDRHRHAIWAVVEEIVAKAPEGSLALKLLPPTDVPFATLEHEIITGMAGRTGERTVGAPGKQIAGQSSTSKVFEPGSYQEYISLKERDLLGLRKAGTIGDRGATGFTAGELDWINRFGNKLKVRLLNRLTTLAWDAMFTGVYSYLGGTRFDFGLPSDNLITAATDWTATGTGNPFKDLLAIVNTNAAVKRVRPLIKGFVINPKTETDIINRALEAGYITNNNILSAGINEVRKFAAPGLPEFIVVDDAWQDETVNADGSVSQGDATYMVPDNKVLVLLDFNKAGALFPQYGQLQIAENLNDPSATTERPAQGVYTFVDDKGLEERKAPHLDIVAGFNGAPNLMRPQDVFLITTNG